MKLKFALLTAIATISLSLGTALAAFAQAAVLTSNTVGSRIRVRSQPTTQASAPHYGFAGDRVQVLWSTQGRDNYTWRYVKFNQSGAEGWIRSDFVSVSGVKAPISDIEAQRLQLQRQYSQYLNWNIQTVKQTMSRQGYRPSETRRMQVAYLVKSYRVAFNYNDRTETVTGVQVNVTGQTN